MEYGGDIASFISVISERPQICYFHNLKFDGTFILDFILKDGYEWVSDNPRPRQFTTLISKTNNFYMVNVCFENNVTVEFRDSLRKLPMSVKRIAKSFGFDEGKGDIDYYAPRPVGYEMTELERDYMRRDVQIVAKALKIQLEEGMTRLTVGSDSLSEYKKIMGTRMFERFFPVLGVELDAQLRKAYKGGFTYADERRKGKRQGSGAVYDVNSLYPYVMYSRDLPYGEPVFRGGEPEDVPGHPLFITSVTFTAKLKANHIPIIQVKGNSRFVEVEYQKIINEPVTLYLTNVDLALYREHYHINVLSYNGTYYFKSAKGLFTKYIDKWMKVKQENKGGLRELAKLHLNSLYGKFGTNPDVTSRIPVLEDNMVKLKMGELEMREPVYIPMGVFITAYARDITIRAAQMNYDTFAYCDTDSLHLITREPPKGIHVDELELGAWDREGGFTEALYIRAKQYMERMDDGSMSVHIAGLPLEVGAKLTFDDVWDQHKIPGSLKHRTVPGGVVLTPTHFTVKL